MGLSKTFLHLIFQPTGHCIIRRYYCTYTILLYNAMLLSVIYIHLFWSRNDESGIEILEHNLLIQAFFGDLYAEAAAIYGLTG